MAGPTRSWSPFCILLLVLAVLFEPLAAVKYENFKTCAQCGFCTRNRAYADEASRHGSAWKSPYTLDTSSIALKDGLFTGTVIKTIDFKTGETVRLPLEVALLKSGAARLTIDEEKRRKGEIELRHGSKVRKERYDESAKWAIVGGLERNQGAAVNADSEKGTTRVVFGDSGKHEMLMKHEPFTVEFKRDGETQIIFNERGYMSMEHWRSKIEKKQDEPKDDPNETSGEVAIEKTEGPDESTWWEESFGGNTDTKPRGPESVALDISFPGYEHVFGIPEHTGPLSLKQTRGGEGNFEEPYRLFNADVFEYIMDSPMTLYGSIPYMQAHKKGSSVGVFWLNAAETWIDITKSRSAANAMTLGLAGSTDTQTHWFSESGLLDVFVFLGPTPQDNSETFAALTGYTQLPPQFATAYHQCRWNYVTDEDVRDVDKKFDKHDIPYDVIWLDIEYTDGKKYFTWDPHTFADPLGMQNQLEAHQRKLVAIIDPHIKNEGNYFVIDEMKSKDLAVKNKDGAQYEGWCWPGSSYWVDTFSPAAVRWWVSLFKFDRFKGTTTNCYIWNDMNEPSVFNGPETTMPKDNIHYGDWEHRDVHNINGLTLVNATYQALLERDGAKRAVDRRRPFVLTRAFYAGSQRLGAMWTGDNQAEWDHLAASLPMIMQNGVSGFPFAGADVGGFFGNPSKELLTRWYQAGAFYPFFRAHAHIDTRRREPYLAGDPYTSIITSALRLRYSLLPSWYTAFHTAHTQGLPIVRPNWYVFPDDSAGFGIDDQMYLADTGLLVKPVTSENASSTSIYLSDARSYYDYFDFTKYAGSAGRTATMATPLDKIPLLMRAGHVFARRDRPRRSSGLMKWDPFTLVIVWDSAVPEANGTLYYDDGETFRYEEGAYIHRRFAFGSAATSDDVAAPVYTLISEDLVSTPGPQTAAWKKHIASLVVERIVVVGAPDAWAGKTTVGITEESGTGKTSNAGKTRSAPMVYHAADGSRAAWAVVKRPEVKIADGWKVTF